jgi:hypothetical protein
MLFIVLLICLAVSAKAGFLTAGYHPDAACATEVNAEAYIPMDKCIQIPEIPGKSVPAKSVKPKCTQNADGSIEVSGKAYATSSKCSGLGIPLKETIKAEDAKCNNGAMITCVDAIDTLAGMAGDWPSVGMYFGDASCAKYDVLAAFKKDTCTAIKSGDDTGSAKIADDGTNYDVSVYKGPTDCSGDPTKALTVPKNACTKMEVPSTYASKGKKTYRKEHLIVAAAFSRLLSAMGADITEEEMTQALGAHRETISYGKLEGADAPIYAYGATAKTMP